MGNERWRGAVAGSCSPLAPPEVEEGDGYLSVATELTYSTSWKPGPVRESFPPVVKGV